MKPILFNTEMVQAILDGRKTVTRRNIKNVTIIEDDKLDEWRFEYYNNYDYGSCSEKYFINTFAPYQIDDILYVRETFANTWTPDSEDIGFIYKADGVPKKFPYWGNAKQYKDEVWIPSIHMPKEAARIFLRVTDIRVEKLQDITDEQTLKEGIQIIGTGLYAASEDSNFKLQQIYPKTAFKYLWNSTIKKQDIGKYDWNSNPYVWVIEFERCEKPND